MKTKHIIIAITILVVLLYILINFRYKVAKTLIYNDKNVEIVLDRWRSGFKSFYYNNNAGMHYAPYYKVLYNDKAILKAKLDYRPDVEYWIGISEHDTYIENSHIYIYIGGGSFECKLKLPLNNKINKLSDLEVECYLRESNNEFNKAYIYTYNNGRTLTYYNKIKGEDANKMLRGIVKDY